MSKDELNDEAFIYCNSKMIRQVGQTRITQAVFENDLLSVCFIFSVVQDETLPKSLTHDGAEKQQLNVN